MKQKYSSKNTSVNSRKVPALFKKIKWKKFMLNLDIGGGKYDTATKYLDKILVRNIVYDPFNRSKEHNDNVLKKIDMVDSCTISNVLNVIYEKKIRLDIIKMALRYTFKNHHIYISIYEGNKTGVGKVTSKGWQNNKPVLFYASEILENIKNVSVSIKNKVITVTRLNGEE